MRKIRTAPPKDEREYPLVIAAEEKDKVLNFILVQANGRKSTCIDYKNILDLTISRDQYEIVLKDFKERGLIEYNDYELEDSELELELNNEIYNLAEKGGFVVERDLYTINFDILELELKRLEKELDPTTAKKLNDVIANANNITGLVIGLKTIAEMCGS